MLDLYAHFFEKFISTNSNYVEFLARNMNYDLERETLVSYLPKSEIVVVNCMTNIE